MAGEQVDLTQCKGRLPSRILYWFQPYSIILNCLHRIMLLTAIRTALVGGADKIRARS